MTTFFVRPLNLMGSVEHYFHFLFGYLIPFLENVPKNDGNRYLFRNCGPVMNEIILGLEGYRTGLVGKEDFDGIVSFVGYDSPEFPNMNMELVRNKVFQATDSLSIEPEGKVLVVERAKPHEFYSKDSEIRESGSSRRSVPNMLEVFRSIKHSFPTEFVCLEGMALKEQVNLFRSRRFFVLQHGAAMANLLFAPKGSIVIEIRNGGTTDYFLRLKQELRFKALTIGQAHNHAEVDPQEVLNSLRSMMISSIKML